MSNGSNESQRHCEKMKPLYSEGSVLQLHSSSTLNPNTSISPAGDPSALPDKPGLLDHHHACKYCETIFKTHTDKQLHEHRIHEHHLHSLHVEKSQQHEENLQRVVSELSRQEIQFGDNISPVLALGEEQGHTEQYMLDISSNTSENLSFYIDGKIVSTSTVSNCEAADINSGSSALVGLDALILDSTQISQVFNTDSGKEITSQPFIKRRTATPPLLPQIKTELESEVVVPSSSSALASSLIQNLLPQNTESIVAQKERTVFLSPKLKQILEKQDSLKPTLALLSVSQTQCSPVSLSVLPQGAARFKRRTGSPQQNASSSEEPPSPGSGEFDVITEQMEYQQNSTVSEDNEMASAVEPAVKPVMTENWPLVVGGNPCNQQPLDLSNTFKRNEDLDSDEAALDLSFQKKSLSASKPSGSKDIASDTHLMEEMLLNRTEANISLVRPEASLVTDLTIVTGSDFVSPVEPVRDGLVYRLTLPNNAALTPSPAAVTPVALTPASPCTITFASSAPHTMLPTTPSLITVLASPPPPSCSGATSQPIQLLAPNLSSEPLVISTNNTLSSSECNLSNTFAASNSTNLITLSQPLDPSLNLASHVFFSDPIALNPPILESTSVSEVPFTPTVTLSDPLLNSYNIASNTVLIECTIALEAPGSAVPASIALQHNTSECPAQTQMLGNHVEQQQIMSIPSHQIVDPSVLVPSIAESVAMSSSRIELSENSTVCESITDPEPVDNLKPLPVKANEAVDGSLCLPEFSNPPCEKEEEPVSKTTPDAQQQAFTKNFICNVCDKLFHSMKELGDHISDHAEEWPYKCEFCVLLFSKPCALLEHRSSLHGVGKTYVCKACTKEFVYLCNLKQHQEELHPGQQCSHSEEEKGKLRPQNYNNLTKVDADNLVSKAPEEKEVKKEEGEGDVATEELFTTIKFMASEMGKTKGPDVRLGINQHYPSFKPPPFPYHNRSPAGLVASATNFTTHNIPQTFSTAIRCTKCGKSFDNMPELHKHILSCANASDKRRYTPRKNPIPLRHFAKDQNGVLSSTNPTNGLNTSIKIKVTQSNRSEAHQEASIRYKVNKKKKKLAQRVMPQRLKSAQSSTKVKVSEQQDILVCPHCRREFTRGRSRTKHMAVCHKKPKEVKRRKQGMVSVTKENDRHFHRVAKDKRPSSPQHKTRLQTSGSAKRPSILPGQTTFSSKRCKTLIKESTQPKQETDTLSELPIGRTFNPAMHQYRRAQHSKGTPVKLTAVKPQRDTHTCEDTTEAEQSV